jgi:hypothetical protein
MSGTFHVHLKFSGSVALEKTIFKDFYDKNTCTISFSLLWLHPTLALWEQRFHKLSVNLNFSGSVVLERKDL